MYKLIDDAFTWTVASLFRWLSFRTDFQKSLKRPTRWSLSTNASRKKWTPCKKRKTYVQFVLLIPTFVKLVICYMCIFHKSIPQYMQSDLFYRWYQLLCVKTRALCVMLQSCGVKCLTWQILLAFECWKLLFKILHNLSIILSHLFTHFLSVSLCSACGQKETHWKKQSRSYIVSRLKKDS